MKLLAGVPFLFLVGAIAQNASSTGSSSSAAADAAVAAALKILASMPSCGLQCLEAAVATTPCAATDVACQLESSCTNATLQAQVELCVAKSCTLRQALTTKNSSVTLCQMPVRDESSSLIAIALAGFGVAFVAFVLRMVSRGIGEGKFTENSGWDDVIMCVAIILVGGISACSVILAKHGLGKDIWTVPFNSITTLLHIYYIDEVIYIITLPLIKVSIVVTYLRVFTDHYFRIGAWFVIALNGCYVIAFVLVTAFQCSPVSYAWTRWDGEHEGTCLHVNAQIMAAAAVNILLDVIIVVMPMPYLWKLQMGLAKKLMVMAMFGVGIFVTVVSILRLQYVVKFAQSQNVTWDYQSVGSWSVIEMDASVLCACMPGLRRFFKTLWPKLLASTKGRSQDSNQAKQFTRPGKIGTDRDDELLKSRSTVKSEFIPLHDLDEPTSTGATNQHRTSSTASLFAVK